MLKLKPTTQYKKEYKKLRTSGEKNIHLLKETITLLATVSPLPPQYKDHHLQGTYQDTRDCHIQGDWFLIYQIVGDTLYLIRTGSHSELF